MRRAVFGVAVLALVVAGFPRMVHADDPWENGFGSATDDGPTTTNFLVGGLTQVHDLEGLFVLGQPSDVDFAKIVTLPHRSYELLMTTEGLCLFQGSCTTIDRTDALGLILTAGVSLDAGPSAAMVVRWISNAAETSFSRVRGQLGLVGVVLDSTARYNLAFKDTTYDVPRFNNNATQVTVFLIRNASAAAITGEINFYGPTGTLLHTEPLNVALNGIQVTNTAAIPALAGISGSATIAHTGGYGGLAAKAVALEPATGFSFDSPALPALY